MAICSYCEESISLKDVEMEMRGLAGIRQLRMYSCPHCKKVLGFSDGWAQKG